MAPLDWDRLMQSNPEDLEEEEAEEWYQVLEDFEVGDEDNVERIKKLFEVTQTVMVLKNTEVELTKDALNEAMSDQGRSTAKKDQDIEDLRREVAQLKRENKDLERYGSEGVKAITGKDETRYLRDQVMELESNLEKMEMEAKEREAHLREEKTSLDQYIERTDKAEKELRDLKRENEQLRDDIRDLQRQIESQRESILAKRDDDVGYRDKMTQKNKLLSTALEESQYLSEANVQLEDKIKEMKKEMKEGKEEIERTTDDYLKLKMVVDQSDSVIDGLRRENMVLQDQVADLMEQVKTKGDNDDEIMVKVNEKVEQWKGILADKDQHVQQLQEELLHMREQLVAANMDSEKTSVAALSRALEDRDRQINELKQRMDVMVGEMESDAALMEDCRSEMTRAGKGDRHMMKISQLQGTLKYHESQLKDAESRALEAESDARQKDKELNEAWERVRKLENGEYGLPEAVTEIKELKQQINARDRQIEELTKHINENHEQLNDLYDETEDLRERLGLDPKEPLDLTEFKKKKGLRMQEDRALNRVLQKEIESLEEERLEMKAKIRKLAQLGGTRAVALGLEADDMARVEEYIEDLKERKKPVKEGMIVKTEAVQQELKARIIQHDAEVGKKDYKLDQISRDNAELKAKNKELSEENRSLEKGLREIHAAIKEHGETGVESNTLQCPTLERMLAAIETKNLLGTHDTSLYLKAQVDNLTGHNEELRKELREVRVEATRAHVEGERQQAKAERLEVEVTSLKEAGAGGFFQPMALPDGMAVASSDVIASLNERLVQVLQELHLKEGMLKKMEESLDTYRRKFAVVRHQQGLLYQEYHSEKKQWETGQEELKKRLAEVQGKQEDDQVRIQEFEHLLKTLSRDEPEVRRELAELTRKVTVLRVNEKVLTRKFTGLQEMEGYLRRDNNKLRNDMILMEAAVAERLGYLQRHKELVTFKLASLQRMLDDSVPEVELDTMNRKFTELTEKYRDQLEKSNTLVARSEAESGYEIEVKRLLDDNNYLKKELGIEKEKLHTLEAAFEKMKGTGAASSKTLRDSEVLSISKKLTTLEMKELNERQRAEHANRMYETQKRQLRDLEDRNFELEQKFAELTRVNISQQQVERNLRDELANCVTKTVSNADRKKIADLEGRETSLRVEVSKLKDIAEVASSQVQALESQQVSREKEVTSLRQQLIDFQAQSDEKTIIGKLHRHIVQLQISEGMALRKHQEASKKSTRLEAQCLRTEQRMDDRDQTIYHTRLETRSKVRYLKHTVQDLRSKYSGAVPLQDQEKFAKQMMRVMEEKHKIELDYKQTNEERRKVEDRLDEVEVQHKGLQDLIATLKDGKGAQKVVEWQNKMEQVRLEDLRVKREVERLKQQIKFQEGILKKHEGEVLALEEEKVRLGREFDTRQLEWEHREVELERIIANMEQQQAEIAGAATQFEDAVGALPDTSLPVPQQLEIAVTTIRNNVKLVLDARAEAAFAKKKIEELEQEVKDKNKEILSRDRIINELRLRLPPSADRDRIIAKATAKTTGSAAHEEEDIDYEKRQAVRVAQSTVHHLQQRVHQKDETIHKYEELLKQARDEMEALNRQHQEEISLMQEKLNNKTDVAFHKYKQAVQESLAVKAGSKIITNDQLRHLNELEDTVATQDNAIGALREKLTRARQEIQDWRFKHDEALRQYTEEKDGLMGDHSEAVTQVRAHLDRTRKELVDMQTQCEMLQEELQAQKEANSRAPTATMKKLVERLRNELALKEKQHQALSKALMELRGGMVNQALDEVKAHAEQNALEINVKKLVDKESKELKIRVEELDGQVTKMRKEKKKLRETETTLTTELDETRQELAKKEGQLRKAQSDRQRLEREVEELERKVDRMNTMGRQVAGSTGLASSENLKQELEEMRRKNRLLQDEVKRSRHQPEKPYEQQGKDAASGESVAKWEEGKRYQKQADRLKTRLKEKEAELEKLNKSTEMLKHALDRANKDKELLEQKLRAASKVAAERPISRETSAGLSAAAPPRPQEVHSAEEVKRQLYQMEEENSNLRRQLTQGRDAAFQEVQLRNKFLSEKLETMEQQLQQKIHVRASQEGAVGQNTYRELARKESDLQKDVMRLTDENLQLRFDLEQAKTDVPRLKGRVVDLEKYVEILKEEKRQLEIMRSSSRSLDSLGSLGSSLSGNYKRIGESGKSTRELEKTIALLKKVVDKVRNENAELKKAPGVVSNEQLKMLQQENQRLKSQLEELRSKMGGTLSERYVSQQKGTARVMADHDKLRRDLLKSQDETDRLRVQLKERDLRVETIQRALEDAQSRAERVEARQPSLTNMGSKEWSSVVLPRMTEEKLKSLEADLQKKNASLSEVKVLLREAADREQRLVEESRELQEKVEVLERFPQGAPQGATEVTRDLQLARLKVDRLENEKRQLVNEVQLLRKHPVEKDADQLVYDLTTNNKLRTENVELRTQLRSVEHGKQKLTRECDRLTRELNNFGPDFFNEIEDLKFNYRESVQRNVQYEEQLAKLSRQFGVSVDIPGGL